MSITQCEGGPCPLKDSCLRHNEQKKPWAWRFDKIPWDGEQCKHYIHDWDKNEEDDE